MKENVARLYRSTRLHAIDKRQRGFRGGAEESSMGTSYVLRPRNCHPTLAVQRILNNVLSSQHDELAQYQHHPKHDFENIRSRNPTNISMRQS